MTTGAGAYAIGDWFGRGLERGIGLQFAPLPRAQRRLREESRGPGVIYCLTGKLAATRAASASAAR